MQHLEFLDTSKLVMGKVSFFQEPLFHIFKVLLMLIGQGVKTLGDQSLVSVSSLGTH